MDSYQVPGYMTNFAGRVLTEHQMDVLDKYQADITNVERLRVLFDHGDFHCITFREGIPGTYTVYALHRSLGKGPEYYINNYQSDGDNEILAHIIMGYLDAHPELGIHRYQFL
jgi:hypothetical protein